jgi:hypothetical protein
MCVGLTAATTGRRMDEISWDRKKLHSLKLDDSATPPMGKPTAPCLLTVTRSFILLINKLPLNHNTGSQSFTVQHNSSQTATQRRTSRPSLVCFALSKDWAATRIQQSPPTCSCTRGISIKPTSYSLSLAGTNNCNQRSSTPHGQRHCTSIEARIGTRQHGIL